MNPSKLQRASRAVNYNLGFKLHTFHPHTLYPMPISTRTHKLIAEHTYIIEQLKTSSKDDYQIYKQQELRYRKKIT